MGDEIRDECGVAAVYLKDHVTDKSLVPRSLYPMMFMQQNRGRLSAGFTTFDTPENETGPLLKEPLICRGEVKDLFCIENPNRTEEIMNAYSGRAGIGHVRYATVDVSDDDCSIRISGQPMFRVHSRPFKEFCFAFNGTISNYKELRERLSKGYRFKTNVDTEVFVDLISLKLKEVSEESGGDKDQKPDMFEVCKAVMPELEGSYSGVFLSSAGDLMFFRNPGGEKPLCYSENDDLLAVASESSALEMIGLKEVKDVTPGSCFIYNGLTLEERALFPPKPHHCHFEWVYFSKVTSVLEGKSVYLARRNLGAHLAEIDPLKERINREKNPENWVVVPAPFTSIPSAEEYAHNLGIRRLDAILKNSDARTFINSPVLRDALIDKGFNIIPEIIRDKNVIFFDDSIVKGSTILKLIKLIKSCNPNEIHIRSTEPPILFPCYRGVDMAKHSDLIANKFPRENLEEGLREYLKVDSVMYARLEGVVSAIGLSEDHLCLECISGNYRDDSVIKRAEESLMEWKGKK